MIEEICFKCDGASGQLQSTKLTTRHFDTMDECESSNTALVAVNHRDDLQCNIG